MFAAWFASGMIMIYVPFPSLSEEDRFAAGEKIDIGAIAISPNEALSKQAHSLTDRLRLINIAGRPAYVIHANAQPLVSIYADDGTSVAPLSAETAQQIGEHFTSAIIKHLDTSVMFDQWVVHQQFDPYRPFYRLHIADTQQTVLYISQQTGEVMQQTNSFERRWNTVGAIVHWIYPTVIRKNWALWDQLVWWLSLIGIFGAALGLYLGIVRLRRARNEKSFSVVSPFTGWMRWHHILGLCIGLFGFTWIVSGWLSMDHGRLFSAPDPTLTQIDAFKGMSVLDAAARIPLLTKQPLADANEIEYTALAGQPLLIMKNATGEHLFALDKLNNFRAYRPNASDVSLAATAAWPNYPIADVTLVSPEDNYAHLRERSLGKDVMRIIFSDPAATWVHVDLNSARIVSVMDRSLRVYRWLFNGLHSLDFPGLINRRPLWDITILGLLALGLCFCMTGVVIGFRRLCNCIK